MASAWAVVDGLLEADVLTSSEQVKRTEWRGWIRLVQHEGADHPPRTHKTQAIGLRPVRLRESTAKLSEVADEGKVYCIAGLAIAGHRVARHAFALEHPETHASTRGRMTYAAMP